MLLESLMLVLEAQRDSMPTLRERLGDWLQQAGATDAETFDVMLASAEVFSNAIEHAEEPTSPLVEVQSTLTEQAIVTVSIRDHGRWRSHRAPAERVGIGLVIVEAVMDSFQVDSFEGGTMVTMQRRLGR
jgi:anti-sigma regulatory factor (Ser/Thr protein kinase)